MPEKLAIIIPTRNRLALLTEVLRSLDAQVLPPNQTIIVDGSDEPMEEALKGRCSTPITYVRVFPPSLTKQRNAGIGALHDDNTLVGYLDDDVFVEPEAVQNLVRFFEKKGDEVGGASFHITNNPAFHPYLPFRLFYLRSKGQGKILKSGFSTIVHPGDEAMQTEWLCGGATVWRRRFVDEMKYDEWFSGTAYFEDVDFSYRVGKTSRLYVVGNARIQHNPPPFIPKNTRYFAEMNVTYRHYFVKKHFKWAGFAFYWSSLGQMLGYFLSAVGKMDIQYLYRLQGSIIGMAKVLTGRSDAVTAQFRS